MALVSKYKSDGCEIDKITESSRRRMLTKERLAGLSEVWGGIAHEMNNPLQIILGKTQILLMWMTGEKESSRSAQDLMTIEKSAKRISELIDCLNDLKEPGEEETNTATETDIDVNCLIASVLSLIRISLKDKKIELETVQEENVPKVRGNPSRLKKLFLFLALNAKLRLDRGEKLRINIEREKEFLKVEFSDEGKDYSSTMRSFLENPLIDDISERSCFGLLNCHQIVKNHQGDLEIAGKLERGNRIIVRLPSI